MARAQRDCEASCTVAERISEQQRNRDRPEQPVQRPLDEPAAGALVVEPLQREHHEGECHPVVQSGFTRKAMAHPIAIGCVVDAHVAGEHRVGRSQHRTEQHR
jgi:hypothetical protein